jgi:hypothetical protein
VTALMEKSSDGPAPQVLKLVAPQPPPPPGHEPDCGLPIDPAHDPDPDPLSQLKLAEAISQLGALRTRLATPALSLAIFQDVWHRWPDTKKYELADAFVNKPPGKGVDLVAELLRASVRSEVKQAIEKALAPDRARCFEGQREALEKALQSDDQAGPIWMELRKLDPQWCDRQATAIAEAIFPRPDTKTRPTAITTGITVQVDGFCTDRCEDRLADIQGVALLLRDGGTPDKPVDGPWYCLNLARAEIDGEPLADAALLPSKLAYQDGLSTASLTYDNQPLAVPGPLAAAPVSGSQLQPQGGASSPLDAPLLDFKHCKPQAWESAGRMPELVFGRRYEVLPFLVTNSGAIPKALACGEEPWRLAETIPDTLTDDLKASPVAIDYRRTVSVGALRYATKKPLPAAPAGVAPRLRELPPALLLPSGDPLLQNLSAETADDTILSGTPLVLLASPALKTPRQGVELPHSLDFAIAGPTLDLRTWDRWVAADRAVSRERRMFVWRSFHEKAYEAARCQQSSVSLAQAGVFLDDPAVVGIWAELQSVSPQGELDEPLILGNSIPLGAPAGCTDWSHWRQGDATLRSEQRGAVTVSVEALEGGLQVTVRGIKLCAKPEDPRSRTITPHGLCRLTLYGELASEGESLFADFAREAVRTTDTGKRLTSPWHLLIEVVPQPWAGIDGTPQTREKLDRARQALWNALKPGTVAARGGVLSAELDLQGADFASFAWQVDRAEVLHQVWGWRGRPPAEHPDLAPDGEAVDGLPPNEELDRYLSFEMAEFGERADEERRDLPMQRQDCRSGGAGPFFFYQEDLAAIAPAGDLRAMHHRLSARIWNRYRAVLPSTLGNIEARDKETRTRWRRLFVPCRFRGLVPVPKIKFVLPLTQEDPQHPGRGPGLLVAVDGPWYQVGGLAEQRALAKAPGVPVGRRPAPVPGGAEHDSERLRAEARHDRRRDQRSRATQRRGPNCPESRPPRRGDRNRMGQVGPQGSHRRRLLQNAPQSPRGEAEIDLRAGIATKTSVLEAQLADLLLQALDAGARPRAVSPPRRPGKPAAAAAWLSTLRLSSGWGWSQRER